MFPTSFVYFLNKGPGEKVASGRLISVSNAVVSVSRNILCIVLTVFTIDCEKVRSKLNKSSIVEREVFFSIKAIRSKRLRNELISSFEEHCGEGDVSFSH